MGTRLEVVRLDERWDNIHAMIVRDHKITIDMRVLTGPSAGEVITQTLTGSVVTALGDEPPGSLLPDWLEVAPTSVGG